MAFNALIDNAEQVGFDFTTQLKAYKPKVLFLYSELNRAYQLPWAQKVSGVYPNAQLEEIKACGHEMFHFAWPGIMEKSLSYLKELK